MLIFKFPFDYRLHIWGFEEILDILFWVLAMRFVET
jgi:hypothetical protein